MPNVYQQATATVTATPVSVHVGGAGTISLNISNTASAGATSEALIASAVSLTGGFSLAGFTLLSNPAGSGGTILTGINDDGTVIGYYLSPSTGTGTGNQNAAAAGTELPTSFIWTSAAGYTTIASVAPETGTYGNGSTIPPGPDAPNGYAYIASGISGGSAVSYFGAGANPVFNGTIVLGTAVDYTNTATGNPVYNGPATVDSAQARFSGSTAYATFTTPAYLSATFLAPNGYYNGPGISQNGSYASLTKVLNTGSVEAVGDFGTALVAFDLLATQVGATNSWATGVNDSHVYVGTYQNSTGYHGFTGTMNATGTFVFGASFDIAGATNTYLMAIDNNGDIAGYFTDAGGTKHGFADVNGVVSTIDIGPGATVITGINDSGTVTGYFLASGSSIDVGFVGSVPQTPPIAAGSSTSNAQFVFSTAQAGTVTGTATLALTSDGNVVSGDTNGLTSLGTTTVALKALVFNEATASVTAAPVIVHVGDAGTITLTAANTAPAGTMSESLIVSRQSNTGAFSLAGFTTLANPAGSGGTVITGINDDGTVVGYYLSPSTGTGTGNQNAATAGTQLPTSFTWTAAGGYTLIAPVAAETGTFGNGTTIPPGPDAPDGYSYIASGISGSSAVSYFGAGANPVFSGTIVLGTAVDYTNTATGNPVYNGPATVDSAQARFAGTTAYPTFTTPAYLSATFLAPTGLYNGPAISQSGSYASLTKVLNTGSVEAVGDFGTALVAFDLLATQVGATNSWATGVNDSHVYVGTYQNSTGYHGFTGTVNATGTFVFGASFDIAGASNTYLMAIDNNGDIAGTYADGTGREHGFAVVNGVVSTIDVGDGNTVITGINDSLQVTGYSIAVGSSIDVGFVGYVPQTAPIAAGPSGNVALITFSTAQAGVITGNTTLALTSDGNTVTGDTLGLTSLGTISVALSATVNNYATAALQAIVPTTARFSQSGATTTINLGTLQLGSAAATVSVAALNAAIGQADVLSGSFAISTPTGFTNTGFADFSGLAAGQSDSAPVVTLTTAQAGTFTETVVLQATGSNASGFSAAVTSQTLTVTGVVAPPCYAEGTLIRTARGDVAVEALQIGDVAICASGRTRPIVWIGHRHVTVAQHPQPETVWPVRIDAHAFGPGLPSRPLLVSPDHAIFAEGVLIAARDLVNGTNVRQMPVAQVTYWHVELDAHDILLAEGLPAESYLENGNRADFAGGDVVTLHPMFAGSHGLSDICAPLVRQGAVLAKVVGLLASTAQGTTSQGTTSRAAKAKAA